MIRRHFLALATAFAMTAPVLGHAADLTIDIEGITSQQGRLMLAVMGSAEAWKGQGKPAAQSGGAPDGDGTLSLKVADLAPGSYAIRVMHDENDNGKLDTNVVGMPTEGYGFSNNPQVMRAATFEEARFEVTADGATVRIVMR